VRSFVLDGSTTLAWCFEDESDDRTEAVLASLGEAGAITPAIWPLEVANGLLAAERRGRTTAAKVQLFLEALAALPILVQEEDRARTLGQTLALARETGLSAYDAAYLELALRTNQPLATLDEPLRRAARGRGVDLLPPD